MKRFLSFFMPGGILFLAALFVVHREGIAASLPEILGVYPYIVLACAVLIGWRFNRSSLVFAAVVLAVSDRALMYIGSTPPAGATLYRGIFDAVAVLLPLNLAALCLMKERGLLTIHGIIRILLIALQPAVVAFFLTMKPGYLPVYLGQPFTGWKVLSAGALSQPAMASFCLAFVIVGFRFIRNQGAKESGFFWALASCLAGLLSGGSWLRWDFYFATAGLILLVSMIEASYAMAFRDELTGLPARRALKEDLLKLGSRYTLAMLDIDHFKKFNDRHGHDVGDQVLRMVAAKLSEVSGGGRAYRYGGEEFTVIFPGRHADDAAHHLEELRKGVASTGFTLRGRLRPIRKPRKPRARRKSPKQVSVTVSIGMATRDETHTKPQDVLKAADKALYRAKKEGRNRLIA